MDPFYASLGCFLSETSLDFLRAWRRVDTATYFHFWVDLSFKGPACRIRRRSKVLSQVSV